MTWYDEIDGIKHVPGADGVLMPVFDDHWIVADTKKTFVVNFYYPQQAWGWDASAPVEIHMVSEYHSTEEETLDAAFHDQSQLEREGRFIPVFHRS